MWCFHKRKEKEIVQSVKNCAVSFEALSKWSNYLSVLVEAEDMSPWTGTTEEPSSRTLTR